MNRRLAYLSLGVVSASALILELALARLFSALLHYHFAFLAISLALFGSASSGVFIYVVSSARPDRIRLRWLRDSCLAAGVAVWLLVAVALAGPGGSTEIGWGDLILLYGAAALPFFFTGCAVTLAISTFRDDIGRLYLFDLAGGATGCLLLVPALELLGAVNTLLLAAALSACAAAMFARSGARTWRSQTMPLLAAAAILLGFVLNAATTTLDIRAAKGSPEHDVLFSKWNSFSRVTVQGDLADRRVQIKIDADAATFITRLAGDRTRHHIQLGRIEALVYHLRPRGHALVIGPGGGDDVMLARLRAERRVTAVEVNPIIARDVMGREPFLSYSGRIFEQPGVTLVVDEARSFIRRSRDRYEVIQGTMVDTWAATAAGALALTENQLYTVEAFRDFVDHLAEDGVLSMTRWYFQPPDQLLRLVSISRALMAERRTPRPDWHVMLIKDTRESHERAPATLLLKRSEFTAEEVAVVEGVAARNGLEVLYTPRTRPENAFTRLLEARDPSVVWASLRSDVAPTHDDSPFFFHTVRLRDLPRVLAGTGEWRKTNLGTFMLMALVLVSLVVVTTFVLGPLAVTERAALAGRGRLASVGYFACLGLGFITVEVSLVQRMMLLLGQPVYSLTVVLFSVLLFSALGSGFSARFGEARLAASLRSLLVVVTTLVVLHAVTLPHIVDALVHLPRALRILAAVAIISPLSFVMGMPMPLGIRALARRAPALIPWAWGVNGATSVAGSAVALLVALESGYTSSCLLGALAYGASAVLSPAVFRGEPAAPAAPRSPSCASPSA
jgi:spermidine synthase